MSTVAAAYYLTNFRIALQWLEERYADLLIGDELVFIQSFHAAPPASQALLVRLIMRKPTLFRRSKLSYPEIGCIDTAIVPLSEHGWIDIDPELAAIELATLFTRAELASILSMSRSATKSSQIDYLRTFERARQAHAWWPHDIVYRVRAADICSRLRLLFFGNFHQDWKEFVLTDLGIYRYDAVAIDRQSRAFQTREDVETLFALAKCRQQFHDDAPLDQVVAALPRSRSANEWLEERRDKLLFQVAHSYERSGKLDAALPLYGRSNYPGARVRAIRMLERAERYNEALTLATEAAEASASDAELQMLSRLLFRLRRRQRMQVERAARLSPAVMHVELNSTGERVERQLAAHLCVEDAPVHYVENALINSLFGLLCWEAIFEPLPGAFFHPFHTAPADLLSPRFRERRKESFARCFDRLASDDYKVTIRQTFAQKQGIHSAFVSWGLLSEALLELALDCIPPADLRHFFDRLLDNLRENTSGLPDLIQFWPAARRYRLIEVKGPGDRLQDNQRRWLEFCQRHGIDCIVCHVKWAAVAVVA